MSYNAMKRYRGILNKYSSERSQYEKSMHHMIPTTDILEISNSKWQNCGDLKKIPVIASGRGCGDRNEYIEHEIFMKNTLYKTIIDRYMSLYICLNHKIEHHE